MMCMRVAPLESYLWKLCGCVMSLPFVLSCLVFMKMIVSCVVRHPPTSPPFWQRPCQSGQVCDLRAGLILKCQSNSATFVTVIIRSTWDTALAHFFQLCQVNMG